MTINPNSQWSRQCNTEYSENNKEEGGLWNRWEFLVFVRAAPITARKSARPKCQPKSRPNFDATPHEATFIVVALPPAQVPCSLSRAHGSESRTHAQYSAMPEILPLSCLPHFSFSFFSHPPLLSLGTRPTSRRVSARLSLFFK
jgi:hypothetical protein